MSVLGKQVGQRTRTTVLENRWWMLAVLGAAGKFLHKYAAWLPAVLGGVRGAMPEA